MADVKTNLGKVNTQIIEEGPAQGRSMLTYVLVVVALAILIWIVYTKWVVHQPFWTGKECPEEEDSDSDDDGDEEDQKKPAKKEDTDVADDGWTVKDEIQKIEDEQDRLIQHKKAEM